MESTVRRHRPPAKWLAAATATLLLLALLPFASTVVGAASVTPATGGAAISADTGPAPGSGTYTALTGPSVSGTGAGDLTAGTLTLTAPSGFRFDSSMGNAGLSGAGCGTLAIAYNGTTATTATATLTSGPSTGACTITFTGIAVRPTAGSPLAEGDITASGIVTGNAGHLKEVAGVATKLGFSLQPVGWTVGIAWQQQPVVQVQDQFGNHVSTVGATNITLAIGVNPSAGALACTNNPVATSAGTATFAGCTIDKVGNGYTLTASGGGYTQATSSTFNITPPVLVFTTQPVGDVPYGTLSTSNLTTQPVVTVRDAGGATITSPNVAVTLSLLTPTLGGPGAFSCSTNPVTTSLGVATFTGCKVNTNSGLGYKLRASATLALTAVSVDSAAFNIFSGTPTKLVFSAQPGGGTGGTVWAAQPVVQIQDAFGQIAIQSSSTSVTLAIGTNPSSGALACTTNPLTVVNGVAAFAGCKIDKTGTAYALTASATGLASATSSAFNITAGTAVKLGFTGQPGASTSNLAFTTQPVVAIQDAGGNTITTAPATTVTLAIGTNPAAGTLTCTSGLTRTTVNGVATFSGCAINNAGVGYTLTATASGYTAATSTAFTVSAPTAGITISASPTAVNRTQSTVLTIQFAAYGASRSVVLQRKTALDSDWVSVGVLTTDSLGRATVSVTPSSSTQYRASFLGTADLLAAVSAPITVGVRYTGNLGPRTSSGSSTLARGTRKTYTGTMRPIVAGQRMSFMIYKWNGSAWVFQTSATISANASGQATFSWTWSRSGRWYIRIRLNADRMYATAWTNLERVTIP